MSCDVYRAISDRVKDIMGPDDDKTNAFIEALVPVCKAHIEQGLDTAILAHTLVNTSFSVMALRETLEECEHFAKVTRNNAETSRKIIREHWPPPDRTKWPYS